MSQRPPLYSQDGNGDKGVAYVKYCTPDSPFMWKLLDRIDQICYNYFYYRTISLVKENQ